jgi:DNA (cytosine-5)-methyltransferase 1
MNPITYGSVCSGIEAVTVAMEPEGWRADWFAEIEPFPCGVLAHHYPTVPNLGDMTSIAMRVLQGEVVAPDVLVGGTPCQAFSVAGSRNSLADERGNLTLRYVELANAIDDVRRRAGQPDAIVWWENVPGVLSTKDNAFGCFLAGLAGEDGELEPPEPRPEAGKSSKFWRWNKVDGKHIASWSNAGAVYGPRRAVAWRTLDAQYFGLAQRRRRVFVVASARNGFDPATVLFEWDGLRRDSSPRRQAGQGAASALAASAGHHGYSSPRGDGSDNLITATVAGAMKGDGVGRDGHLVTGTITGGARQRGGYCYDDIPLVPEVSLCLNAGGMGRIDSESETMIPVAFDSRQDPVSSTEVFGALGSSSPQAQAVALRGRDGGATAELGGDTAFTLRAASGGGDKPHVLAAGVRRLTPRECERLQGFPDDYTLIPSKVKRIQPPGSGRCVKQTVTATIVATNGAHYVGTNHCMTPQASCPRTGMPTGVGYELCKSVCAQPAHAEVNAIKLAGKNARGATLYLQGHTYACDPCKASAAGAGIVEIIIGPPPGNAPDGPRYKALGNSMATHVIRWIGRRIEAHIREIA